MSGHSKWHNIQKTKGAQDAKRAQAFTKIAREMIVAVKEGGSGDPNNNSRLAAVIAKAKAANMPNDNIKRVLEKAAASGSGPRCWGRCRRGKRRPRRGAGGALPSRGDGGSRFAPSPSR